jgi:hypothetical protein
MSNFVKNQLLENNEAQNATLVQIAENMHIAN